MGDQEATEGTTWESLLVAGSRKLNNLVCIIDFNKSGERSIPLNNLKKLFSGFGFNVKEVDGHSIPDLFNTFSDLSSKRPTMIIANTVKGKGVTYLENSETCHHTKFSEKQNNIALKELL